MTSCIRVSSLKGRGEQAQLIRTDPRLLGDASAQDMEVDWRTICVPWFEVAGSNV